MTVLKTITIIIRQRAAILPDQSVIDKISDNRCKGDIENHKRERHQRR